MSKLPSVKTLLVEDISKEAPAWFQNFLIPLNSFMSSVYYALDRDLTFTENIASSIKEISFTTKSNYATSPPTNWDVVKIANPLKKRPIGVCIANISNETSSSVITSAVSLNWTYNNGYVEILYVAGLGNSIKYKITLLIF